jgi:ParB family chromosome partitioning protein
MAAKKRGLGSGLDALIPENEELIKKEEVLKPDTKLKLKVIEPNRNQPRKHFDEDALNALAESIKQYGVLSPLWVRKKEDYYEIIAGERRWRAAQMAGLKEVPVIFMEEDEQASLEISLIENIIREDLNPIEEATAYKRLIEEFHLTQEEVGKKVSKSRPVITNAIRLLDLDERVQQMLAEEKITEGHGRRLLEIADKELQFELATRIMDQELTVRETEKLIKSVKNQEKKENEKKNEKKDDLSFIYQDLEEKMKTIMGTKVSILPKDKKKGKIEVEYYSMEELERIMELLESIPRE